MKLSFPLTRLRSVAGRIGLTEGRAAQRRIGACAAPVSDPSAGEFAELVRDYVAVGVPRAVPFAFEALRRDTLRFVGSMACGDGVGHYRYSAEATEPTLYASVYACMLQSLYGELPRQGEDYRQAWAAYLHSFQDADGLYRDPAVAGERFETTDWWGARHLALHVIVALTALGVRPRVPFGFLAPLYERRRMLQWLESRDWENQFKDDFDNQIMNYGALLQYARDVLEVDGAGRAVAWLKEWLLARLNRNTGLFWPEDTFTVPRRLSRAIMFSYHICSLFTYDGWRHPCPDRLLDHVLRNQHVLGGYGPGPSSSACEDIDSIELLLRFGGQSRDNGIRARASMARALPWVLSNMNEDGGFVFRRNEALEYGHSQMSSGCNQSSMFATWFRTLSLAYLSRGLGLPNRYRIVRCPGLEFC